MVAGDRHIGCDGNIRFNRIRARPCSFQAHFLLHGKDAVDGERGFHGLQGLDQHRHAGPVVEGLSGHAAVCQFPEFPVDRDRRPHINAEVLDLLPVRCPDIDEHVVDLDAFLALLLVHHVRGLAADDAEDRALGCVQDHALVVERGAVPAAKGNEPDEALLVDVFHHQADLVHVGGEHDLELVALLDRDQVAHRVLADLVHVPFEFLLDDRKDAAFTARHAVGIG